MATYLQPNPYEILGVANDATISEIRSAHRKLVLKCHPDRIQDLSLKPIALDQFQKVQRAYELLSDDAARAQYDDQVKLLAMRKEMSRESSFKPFRSDLPQHEPNRKSQNRRDEDQLEAEIVPPSSRTRPRGILVVQGLINGLETQAIPDTGAEFNIIAATFARQVGLKICDMDPGQCYLLRMANGKHIKTTGIVNASWSFASDPSQSWKIILHVLSDFIYDVVLGSHFLFATQTMSHHKERLSRVPRPLQSLSILRVNVLGSAKQLVRGYLERKFARALPDSGSEPNLLSYKYVKQRGWLLAMNAEDQNLLQFADGSVTKTEGSISARWKFRDKNKPERGAQTVKVEFHILRGCSHHVILGQDFLEDTDAFLDHEYAFLEVVSAMNAPGLNLVIWLPKKPVAITRSNPPVSTALQPDTTHEDDIYIELQRRVDVNRTIGRMQSGADRDAALSIEAQLRREYDARSSHETRQRAPSSSTTKTSARISSASEMSSSTLNQWQQRQPIQRSVPLSNPRSRPSRRTQ